MSTRWKFLILIGFVIINSASAYYDVKDSLDIDNHESNNKSSFQTVDTLISISNGQDTTQVIKEQKGDTTYITLGKKRIKIYEENGETSVKIDEKGKKEKQDFENKWPEKKWKRFKGHWAGLEAGFNNYVNNDFSFQRSGEDQFMDIKAGRSWNFNVNFAQYSLGIGTDRFGITTGAGIEWNNYHFSDTNTIMKDNGYIISKPTPENTKKNRFQTTYLTIPLLLEFQFPNYIRKNRAYLSVGGIMGIKLFSNTKVKYIEGGYKQKEKDKSDYYLNSLRFGLTARLGYRDCALFMNYYLTPLFIEDHGPELHPISAGIVISF
jgi:hypothetical protein